MNDEELRRSRSSFERFSDLDPSRVCKGKGVVTLRATLIHIDDEGRISSEPNVVTTPSKLQRAPQLLNHTSLHQDGMFTGQGRGLVETTVMFWYFIFLFSRRNCLHAFHSSVLVIKYGVMFWRWRPIAHIFKRAVKELHCCGPAHCPSERAPCPWACSVRTAERSQGF